jgi:hypothetical protein
MTDDSKGATPVAPSGRFLTEHQEDALQANLIAEARGLGLRLAVRCARCNQWVVAPKSVALHLGPTCRRKIAEQQGVA